MRNDKGSPFVATALALVMTAAACGWTMVQAPGAGSAGAALARAATLALAAAQALHLCWMSASCWLVPAERAPLGWMRTEFSLMMASGALALAVMGASLHALAGEPRLAPGAVLCAALALAFCALTYAVGRMGLLLRKRYKRQQLRVWRASQGMGAAASH